MALDSTAKSYWAGKGRQISAAMEDFAALADNIDTYAALGSTAIKDAWESRELMFENLQAAQNRDNRPGFLEILWPELHLGTAMFVHAAESYGWPEPGQSSGQIIPWMPTA